MGLWQGDRLARKGGNMKLSLHRTTESDDAYIKEQGALLSRLWTVPPKRSIPKPLFQKASQGIQPLETLLCPEEKRAPQDSTFGSLEERDGPSSSLRRLEKVESCLVPQKLLQALTAHRLAFLHALTGQAANKTRKIVMGTV